MNEATPRPYRMGVRAERAAQTRERILDAFVALFWERPGAAFSLDDVAARAGVTVQTVIRRFGGRDGLLAAAAEREHARVARERDPAAIADTADAVRQLVEHYERDGDGAFRLLAAELQEPALAPLAERGRALHRDWCAGAFGTTLERLDAATRVRRLAQIVAVCDVYTWKLLRRDAGLTPEDTETALLELLEPLLEAS
jgi:AcrR family transcriptional regulator